MGATFKGNKTPKCHDFEFHDEHRTTMTWLCLSSSADSYFLDDLSRKTLNEYYSDYDIIYLREV